MPPRTRSHKKTRTTAASAKKKISNLLTAVRHELAKVKTTTRKPRY